MFLILYNPISRNGANTSVVEKLARKMKRKHEEVRVLSLLEIEDSKEFLSSLDADTKIILVGGDGTLNRIANQIAGLEKIPEVYLYKAGTGNDFRRSIKKRGKITQIDQYLLNLPKVKYNKKQRYFLNGVGLGFDGLVCQIVEESKNKKTKRNFYASVFAALKQYQPIDCEVEVDGVTKKYKKAWLVSIMNSKYFGGGMKIAPKASRTDECLYTVIVHGISKHKLRLLFPLIYLGWHTKIKGVTIIKGKEVIVKSNEPTYLQVDGDVVENLTEIKVISK